MLPKFEIFENFDDGIIIINKKGIIRDINREAQRIFNYDYLGLVGKDISLLMFDKDSKMHNIYVNSYIESNKNAKLRKGLELIGKSKNGERIPLYISVMTYPHQEETLYIGLIRDLRKEFLNERLKYNTIFILSEGKKAEISSSGEILNKKEFYQILNLTPDNTANNNLIHFVYKDDRELLRKLLFSVEIGEEIHDKIVRFEDHNSDIRYFSWNSLMALR